MLMKIAVNRGIGMVKQSPFQEDLFDFKYIEDQVSAIKESMEDSENVKDERNLIDVLDQQLSVLHDIQHLLTEIAANSKKKKSWFNFKE